MKSASKGPHHLSCFVLLGSFKGYILSRQEQMLVLGVIYGTLAEGAQIVAVRCQRCEDMVHSLSSKEGLSVPLMCCYVFVGLHDETSQGTKRVHGQVLDWCMTQLLCIFKRSCPLLQLQKFSNPSTPFCRHGNFGWIQACAPSARSTSLRSHHACACVRVHASVNHVAGLLGCLPRGSAACGAS